MHAQPPFKNNIYLLLLPISNTHIYSILTFTYFIATYDVQSIDITSTSGEVCVVCRFSINTIAVGCEIEIRNSTMTLSRKFNRSLTLNIAEGCISNIITGYYDLYVYDVENDNTLSQLPAIIFSFNRSNNYSNANKKDG